MLYVALGSMPLESNWLLLAYGRPSMMRFEYASPMPGKALSWSAVAVLMSILPAGVAADLGPALRHLGQLAPGQHAPFAVAHPGPVGGHEHRAHHVVLLEQRHGLDVKVAVAVVKGDHHGTLRQFARAVRQRGGERSGGDRGKARVAEVTKLIGENLRRSRPEGAHGRVCPEACHRASGSRS